MITDRACLGIAAFVLAASGASGQVTRRVSVDSAGNQANNESSLNSRTLSPDGRWIVFDSFANNLVPGDTNPSSDSFVKDRLTGTVECCSVDPNGVPVGGQWPSISADGRFVAFMSISPDVLPGLSGLHFQVFVRDRSNGTTELVSVDPNGVEGNANSLAGQISADGRWVTFSSGATNLAGGWSGNHFQAFLRDRQNGTAEIVSKSSGGVLADDTSLSGDVSADGRYVAFESEATNLVPGDTNGVRDIFLRDRQTGTTERASVATGGGQADGFSAGPALTPDGRYLAFWSQGTNLVAGDTNAFSDVFLRDLQNATTERVSVSSAGTEANAESRDPQLSSDGRYVVFDSSASNLGPGDTNQLTDIFLRDRQANTTERVNVSSGGAQTSDGFSVTPSVSDDGRFVDFRSNASNVVPLDTNRSDDVFLRDRMAGSETTAFTSLCFPGSGSVIACPCSNPPSASDRGCDNSDATGGAILSAAGNTQLTADGLSLTANGLTTTTLAVLVQGSAVLPNGIVYGQGVRCVGGTIRRLFTASAPTGAATFPNFPAGEPPVSVRSASKGDSIQPGQSRWYLVYYRDTVVLGGCPATSTFNTTQTGEVAWTF
jgi:Tol biopolymer transport system component